MKRRRDISWGLPRGPGRLAKSLFGEANTLVVDSENATTPSLREFDRRVHKAIVFDECAGASLVGWLVLKRAKPPPGASST